MILPNDKMKPALAAPLLSGLDSENAAIRLRAVEERKLNRGYPARDADEFVQLLLALQAAVDLLFLFPRHHELAAHALYLVAELERWALMTVLTADVLLTGETQQFCIRRQMTACWVIVQSKVYKIFGCLLAFRCLRYQKIFENKQIRTVMS